MKDPANLGVVHYVTGRCGVHLMATTHPKFVLDENLRLFCDRIIRLVRQWLPLPFRAEKLMTTSTLGADRSLILVNINCDKLISL